MMYNDVRFFHHGSREFQVNAEKASCMLSNLRTGNNFKEQLCSLCLYNKDF